MLKRHQINLDWRSMRQLIQHIPHTFSASFLLALSPFLVFYRPTQPCACWTVPIFRTKLVIPSELWCHFEGKFLSAIGPGDKFQSQLPLKIKIEENRKLRQRKCSRSCFCTLTKTTNSLLTPFYLQSHGHSSYRNFFWWYIFSVQIDAVTSFFSITKEIFEFS